jgi:hypothetical protein
MGTAMVDITFYRCGAEFRKDANGCNINKDESWRPQTHEGDTRLLDARRRLKGPTEIGKTGSIRRRKRG